jgi:hypothetical protein
MSTKIDKKMATINLMGGLGNQLFQIATAFSYALETDKQFYININIQLPQYYFTTLFKNLKPYFKKFYNHSVIYHEPCFSYKPIPDCDENIILKGYFQTSKYFNKHKKHIQELFEFPPILNRLYTLRYQNFFNNYSQRNIVLVHARRGDYLKYSDIHNPQTPEYYFKASEKIKEYIENPLFVLVSDDNNYWKDIKCFNEDNSIVFLEEETLGTFFFIQQMKYFIISNSTFSWWGCWLAKNNKITIAPSKWYGPQGHQDWQDIYEPSWIII